MSDSEYENEPVRGLPERLPEGEVILWQGEPRWQSLARRTFHTRTIAIYFAILTAARAGISLHEGQPAAAAAWAALDVVPLAAAGIGLLALIAWAMARSTVYTITSRRVVMRFGVVLPMTINIPFKIITAAALRNYPDGTGDIPMSLQGTGRIAYLHLWPHARPWRLKNPEPMLRSVREAEKVAGILSAALAGEPVAEAGSPAMQPRKATPATEPRSHAAAAA